MYEVPTITARRLAEIETEARRLRAQALADGMRSMRGWMSSALTRRSHGGTI